MAGVRAPPPTSCRRQWPQRRDGVEYLREQTARDHELGHLEPDRAPVADDLRADFDQLVAQGDHRPMADRLGQGQSANDVGEVVGQGMQLQSHRVGGQAATGQAGPDDRALAFFDGNCPRSNENAGTAVDNAFQKRMERIRKFPVIVRMASGATIVALGEAWGEIHDGFEQPCPRRPKGMRRATCKRLLDELAAQERLHDEI